MIQTKFNETRFVTNDTAQAMGMFLAKRLIKEWQEDVLDKETGEIVQINRAQVLMERGTAITPETAMSINFHIQAGDITEFEVTDQNRVGVYESGYHAAPYIVTAHVKSKNRKFILYAKGVEQALEIAKDYIELNFPGHFEFVGVKGFNDCIAITDNFKRCGAEADFEMKSEDEEPNDEVVGGKFYLLDLFIQPNKGMEHDRTFLVFTPDAEEAKNLAENWIAKGEQEALERGDIKPDEIGFVTTIKTASVLNCYCVIPPDFTREYFNQEKKNQEQEQEENE